MGRRGGGVEEGGELGDGGAETGGVLRGDVDGEGEEVGGAEDFGGGEEDFVKVPDCVAEFFLDVADAGQCEQNPRGSE